MTLIEQAEKCEKFLNNPNAGIVRSGDFSRCKSLLSESATALRESHSELTRLREAIQNAICESPYNVSFDDCCCEVCKLKRAVLKEEK